MVLTAEAGLMKPSQLEKLQTLMNLQMQYAAAHPAKGFACELAQLKTDTPPKGEYDPEAFLVADFYAGYKFSLAGCEASPNGVVIRYKATAVPRAPGESGCARSARTRAVNSGMTRTAPRRIAWQHASRFDSHHRALAWQHLCGLSARAGLETVLLPEFVPLPDAAPSFGWEAIAELVCQHDDLAAMVGFVRKHVGKHRRACGPSGDVSVANEFRDAAIRIGGEGVGEHGKALRGAFFMGGGGLLHRASVRVKRRGTLEVWGGVSEPSDANVVQMGEDGGDGPSTAFYAGRFRAPCAGIEMREQDLVHGVVNCVGFQ